MQKIMTKQQFDGRLVNDQGMSIGEKL